MVADMSAQSNSTALVIRRLNSNSAKAESQDRIYNAIFTDISLDHEPKDPSQDQATSEGESRYIELYRVREKDGMYALVTNTRSTFDNRAFKFVGSVKTEVISISRILDRRCVAIGYSVKHNSGQCAFLNETSWSSNPNSARQLTKHETQHVIRAARFLVELHGERFEASLHIQGSEATSVSLDESLKEWLEIKGELNEDDSKAEEDWLVIEN
jgi:hypothetical protein